MTAGRYRRRLIIQEQAVTYDSIGQPVLGAWQDVCSVWGYVKALSGRELFAARQAQSEVTTEIGMRYLAGVTSSIGTHMRVKDGSAVYDILAPLPDERRREIVLMCKVVT